MLKRSAMDMRKKASMLEERPIYGVLTVYRERGMYLRRLEQFEKAKAAYDEAYRFVPEDPRLLIGRSRTCADAVQPQQAFADAELALKLEPDNMVAQNTQARALYTMSEFEHSVVKNYRGSWQRTQPPYFTEGINQGLETIKDCVGTRAGPMMLKFLPLIKTHEMELLEDEVHRPNHTNCRIPQALNKRKITQMEARKHNVISRVLAMKYLGSMAHDKFFLEELMNSKHVKSANASGSIELKKVIEHAYRSLSERQEMLRSQRPYYTIKRAEHVISNHQTKHKEQMICIEREINKRNADRMLRQIERSLEESSNVMDLVAKAERLQVFLDRKTMRTLPDKPKFIDRLYRAVGEAYLTQHRLSYNLSERGNRRRVAFLMGMPIRRHGSYDSVMSNYPYRFAELSHAMDKVTECLDMCENATMKCWLYYELSRLYCTQKNFALVKVYGKACQREADELGNVVWWLNGALVVISADMQQGNINEVRANVDEALQYSKKLDGGEFIQSYLMKCTDIASEPHAGDEHKLLAKREKQILKVMCDENLQVRAQHLFKRIAGVPVGRRFPVLPGRHPTLTAERRRYRQYGLTVVPGRTVSLPRAPKSHVSGLQTFDF